MGNKYIVLSLIAGFVLTACGGGGGVSSSSSSSGGSTPGISPSVTSRSPATGATNVSTAGTVTATFKEAILNTSVDSSSFTLMGSLGAVASSVTFNGASNTATLTPNSNLGLFRSYSANLTNGIADLDGDTLAATNWSFTTGDGSWSSVEQLDSGAADLVGTSELVSDDNGNVIAIWTEKNGTIHDLLMNRYVVGTGWGTAEKVNSTVGVSAKEISMNGNGEAVIVWTHWDGSKFRVLAKTYTVGSGLGSEQTIDTAEGSRPKVAVDANGNALVLYDYFDGTNYNLMEARYTVGTGWSIAQSIESNTYSVWDGQFDMDMDSSGNAIAVWTRSDGTDRDIWGMVYKAGSGWGAAEELEWSPQGNNAFTPNIDMDANGNGMLVFELYDGTYDRIHARYYDAATGWDNGYVKIDPVERLSSRPRVKMDSNGDAIAIWNQPSGLYTNRFTKANVNSSSRGWGSPELLRSTGNNFAELVINQETNNAMVVGYLGYQASTDLYSYRYIAGVGWGTEQIIASSVGSSGSKYYFSTTIEKTKRNIFLSWVGDPAGGSVYRVNVSRFQ